MNSILLLRPVSVLVLLCGLAPSQNPAVIRDAFGASQVDGGAWAGGPDYSARFTESGAEFVPRHAGGGESTHSLRFRLESVSRGSESVFERTANFAPEIRGNRVRYAHPAGGPVEVYDARRDGIEQSFVFATKPGGAGDLVVRSAIETDLPLVAASDEGVRFELPGLAGVTFGAVTGVDANGVTTRGSIRVLDGGTHVEWVLPAAFVENAQYPLVLDPLIGSVIGVGDSSDGDDHRPCVAFDDDTNRYLVVWNQAGSASQPEIRGRFVTAGGTALGAAFLVSYGYLSSQAIANINGTNRFLVTFHTMYWSGPYMHTVRVVAVDAGTGAVSNDVMVEFHGTGSSTSVDNAVVGGDSRSLVTSDSALVAYRRSGLGFEEVRTCIVHVPTSGDPVVTATTFNTLAPGRSPRVTAHGGNPLRWLVTWEGATPSSAPEEIRAAVLGTTGALCAPPVLLYTSAAGDQVTEAVPASSDGTTFFVAWQDSNGGSSAVRGKVVTWSGACGGGSLAVGPTITPVTTAGTQFSPTVAFAKDKFLLAWQQKTVGWPDRVIVKGLDPVTCASCGAEWTVENTVADLYAPAIASRFSAGDAASDEALVVWSNNAVRARRVEARGNDVVTAMGGGCVNGFDDFATYSGDAVIGNANFQLAIAGSVSLPLVLIVGFSNLSAPCGACTIVPTPDILFPATNPYTLAIPCDPTLVGVSLYTQWLLLKPSTCPILPDFSFTNALRFTIGE